LQEQSIDKIIRFLAGKVGYLKSCRVKAICKKEDSTIQGVISSKDKTYFKEIFQWSTISSCKV
jgi:hypothetical protein